MRKHGGCLTIWLWFLVFGGAIRGAIGIFNGGDALWPGLFSIVAACFALGTLRWSKFASVGLGACFLVAIPVNFGTVPNELAPAVIVIGFLGFALYTFLVWRIRAQFEPDWQPPGQQTREEPEKNASKPTPAEPVLPGQQKPDKPKVCRKCQTTNDPDAEFCTKCGATFRRVLCPSCGKKNPADADECRACGAPLRTVDCGLCGTKNKPDARFCKKCGTKLSRESTPSPQVET